MEMIIITRIIASNGTFLPNSGIQSWGLRVYSHLVYLIQKTEGQQGKMSYTEDS